MTIYKFNNTHKNFTIFFNFDSLFTELFWTNINSPSFKKSKRSKI